MSPTIGARPRPTVLAAFRGMISNRKAPLRRRLVNFILILYPVALLPVATWFILFNRNIDPAYDMTWPRRLKLAVQLHRNTTKVPTGCSYRAHLVMASKLLEIPPSTEGVVVECGAYLGGTTVNLSLICDIVGRDLIVYDSFEGLPAPRGNDKYAHEMGTGFLRGEVETVAENVRLYGAPQLCQYRKGWFSETLPDHTEPIVMAFLDGDHQASIHDCLVNLWPHLTDEGYMFTDDYTHLELCAVFWSESFWRMHFDRKPPGLIGSASGVGVGQFWMGPYVKFPGNTQYPAQRAGSTAYTRQDFTAAWEYDPEAADT